MTAAAEKSEGLGKWRRVPLLASMAAIYSANREGVDIDLPRFFARKGFTAERAAKISRITGRVLGPLYIAVGLASAVTGVHAAAQIALGVWGFSPALAVGLAAGTVGVLGVLGLTVAASGLGLMRVLGDKINTRLSELFPLPGRQPPVVLRPRPVPAPATKSVFSPAAEPAKDFAAAATPPETGNSAKAPEIEKPSVPNPPKNA
jgi:hypothetical protein